MILPGTFCLLLALYGFVLIFSGLSLFNVLVLGYPPDEIPFCRHPFRGRTICNFVTGKVFL